MQIDEFLLALKDHAKQEFLFKKIGNFEQAMQ
jgi:hypothetical protein